MRTKHEVCRDIDALKKEKRNTPRLTPEWSAYNTKIGKLSKEYWRLVLVGENE